MPGHSVLTPELFGIVTATSRHHHCVLDSGFVAFSYKLGSAGEPYPVAHVVVVVYEGANPRVVTQVPHPAAAHASVKQEPILVDQVVDHDHMGAPITAQS